MALTRGQIIDAAMAILRDYGLADLSMRRLARDLQVQPGALYWHIQNKQDLLTELAKDILAPVAQTSSLHDLALAIRAALLSVRDGAEVAALAHALDPEGPSPMLRIRALVLAQGFSGQRALWAADALINYIFGAVMQEQTRSGLARAGLLEGADDAADARFTCGLELLLAGMKHQAGQGHE